MWSRATLSPDSADEAGRQRRRPAEPARVDRAHLTEAAVRRLQTGAGNAAVTRLLARTLTKKIPSFTSLQEGVVTLPKLRGLKGVLDVAIAEVRADQQQAVFFQLTRIDSWLTQYTEKLSQLEQEIKKGAPADPDTVGVPFDQLDSGTALNTYFKAVVMRLGNIRGELNRGLDEWRDWQKKEAEKEAEEPGWWEEFGGKEKEYGGKGAAESESAPKAKQKAGPVEFPHDGKHQAPPAWFNGGDPIWASFKLGTKDDDAKYKSRNPVTVIAWENEARAKGLTLCDGFTIIYRFTELVGADKGTPTCCVRIDGDHGHPIIETKPELNTAFDTYLKKEVEVANGNATRLQAIADFLIRVGLSPASYKIKVPATTKQ